MKKTYLFLLVFGSATLFAQTNVKLVINHLLDSDPFAFHLSKANNLGHDFNVSRLQYYISEIAFEHDGGTITSVEDYWILANSGIDSVYELGSFNVTVLEAVHFGIGVDTAHNHLDPSVYAATHPLAPKSPSMHWGWEAGYRFLAMEGQNGSGLANNYEIHSLEDYLYFTQRIPTAGSDDNGDLLITLNADYVRIMENIDLSVFLIDHGDQPNNVKSLRNMHDYVFTSLEGNGNTNTLPPSTVGINAAHVGAAVLLYPNPAANGRVKLGVGSLPQSNFQVEVRDMMGKAVRAEITRNNENNYELYIPGNGTYMVSIKAGNELISTKRLVVLP